MKSIITAIIVPLLMTAPMASAFVAEMFADPDCTGTNFGERNVWDNTCAYVNPGFGSFRLKANGGGGQQGTVYSRQACAGPTVWQGCVAGVNSVKVSDCVNLSGAGNALGTWSSAAVCPN